MVNYKCLFCNYESTKKINIQEHYNKNKKCYTDEQIKEYKNMNDLILKSKKNDNENEKRYKCLFCDYSTDRRNVLNNHYQKKNKCYSEKDKSEFINLENLLNKSKNNNTSNNNNTNPCINITILNASKQELNNCIINTTGNYINDIFNETLDHIDIPQMIESNDIENIFDNLIDGILDNKSNHNILIKHPSDSICQVVNTDKNGIKKLEYMPVEKTYKRLMDKLGKILLPVINKLAVNENFPEDAMDKVCGITLFLALVKNKNVKNVYNKTNCNDIKIGTEIKNFYQAYKNSYSCKYSNKYNEIYESIYKYLELNTNILDDIDDDESTNYDTDTEEEAKLLEVSN